MAADEDKRLGTDRRAGDRRVDDDTGYSGPDRRKGERRAGKERRVAN